MDEHMARAIVPDLPTPGAETMDSPPAAADARLLERVTRGEEAALAELYGLHAAAAFGLALRITRDGNLAEDVVQDAFLGAWRNASTYCPARSSVRTWLLSIVHHRAIDIVRRRRSASDVTARLAAGARPETPDVWSYVRQRLDADDVAIALRDLPAVQRIVIEMAYFDGLTQLEIAAATGAPLGTVKSRARLGLMALRRSLGGKTGERAGPPRRATTAHRPVPMMAGDAATHVARPH